MRRYIDEAAERADRGTSGQRAVLASAKVVHDVVLMAISRSGFKVNGTLKGGVVMSALTKDIRRATLDMDIDFVHHPISDAGVRLL